MLLMVLILGVRGVLAQGARVLSAPLDPASAVDRGAVEQVKFQAAQMGLLQVEIFEKQSLRLAKNGRLAGVFVTGKAKALSQPESYIFCFAAMVEPDRVPKIVVAEGGTEYQRCRGAREAGLVDVPVPATRVYLGVIFESGLSAQLDGPHTYFDSTAPRVLIWNGATHRLAIDHGRTKRVLDAEGEDLATMRRVLRSRR
jgi:hypothetical protein